MTESKTEDKILNFDRPPILLIGSGLSHRYLKDYPTWEGLLLSVAGRIGLSDSEFVGRKLKCIKKPGRWGPMPALASMLEDCMFDRLSDGSLDLADILDGEGQSVGDNRVDLFKMVVASTMENYEIVDSDEMREEISELRRLSTVVPAVVTTNYDRFLECEVFPDFKVYSKVSDYYFSDSAGIGEIYKIHGSVDVPESIVINEEDYARLDQNSKIVSAKLLSMLCDYPMIILGYSFSDPDVKRIVFDLISSLDDEKLSMLGRNIIYVSYREGFDGISRGTKQFDHDGKSLILSTIETGRFIDIYLEIAGFEPSVSASNIRRIRQLVRDIRLTDTPSEQQNVLVELLQTQMGNRLMRSVRPTVF